VLQRTVPGDRSHYPALQRHAWRLCPHGALLGAVAVVFCGLLLGAPPASADIVYLYDDLGRLVRVIREDGEAASYHWDAVGNLLQITRASGLSQTTTITATSAASGTQGTTVPLTVTGANLAGASVVCTTPGVSVQQVRTDLDQLTLALVLGASAPLGPVACEVRGLDVVALAFTVVEPPPPVFVAGSAVSVALAPLPENANGAVTGAVSVAVGSGGLTFEAAPAVAVTLVPVIMALTPASGTAGAPSLVLTLTGAGFTGATAVDVLLDNALDPAITVSSVTVDGTGTTATVELAIAPGATPGLRVVRITTPAGPSTAVGTGGTLFTVQ